MYLLPILSALPAAPAMAILDSPRVSIANSSSTVLANDAVFTGISEDVSDFAEITIFVFADQASATNGMSAQFSTDGTNWDRTKTTTISASVSQSHTLAVVTQYFRIVYTNGSVTQGAFRLQTIYHPSKSKHLTTSATQTIRDTDDVEVVRLSSSHELDVARGIYQGQSWVNKFGANSAVGNTEEAIWSSGGDYTGFLQAAIGLEVLSDDADDDSDGAGTNDGAHTVVLEGLDSNFVFQTETVTLNGTGAVATSETDWIRLNRAYVGEVGACAVSTPSTTCDNEGTITIRGVSGGVTMATIVVEKGQTEMAIYTVPAGSTAFLREIQVTIASSANKDATVKFWQRRNVDDVTTPFTARRIIWEEEDINGTTIEQFDYSVSFPEMTDLWFSGIRTGSTDVNVDVEFELLLTPNNTLPGVP